MRTLPTLLGVAVAAGLVTGCAARAQAPHTPLPPPTTAAEEARLAVPQLAAMRATDADGVLTKAGLVPILRYEAGIVSDSGTVVNTDPPAGALVSSGDLITVIIAGAPGHTLHSHIDAHREKFIGIGVDANGVLVIGVHQTADLGAEMSTLTELAAGKAFRVKTCTRSWADLMRVRLDLARREFLPGADKMAFATTIDPLACAVRLTIDLDNAQVAELTGRYQGALVIQKGTATRAG